MIKEITGLGNVDLRKTDSTFLRTDRNYEFKRSLPNNGPSPHPNQFSPKYSLVHSQSPRPIAQGKSNLPRFRDKEYIGEDGVRVRNPRQDKHEGEHTLYGKNPNCKTCLTRFNKVEKQWMVKPLLSSQYANTIKSQTFHNPSHTTRNKLSKTQLGKSTESI